MTYQFIVDNPVLKAYIFHASLLSLKMLVMSLLTGRQRFAKKAFANLEDTKTSGGKVKVDDDVERVRRAHLNDVENIPIFLVAAALYTLTNPSVYLATNLFRAFTISRYLHTLVYAIFVIPQPARAISFFVGYGVTGYILVQTLLHFL